MEKFEEGGNFAHEMDRQDALHSFRNQFYFPTFQNREAIYFCGNSLGLQPKNAVPAIAAEMEDWQRLAVGGYTHGRNPWLYYQHFFQVPLSRIVGCLEEEVTVMNTLTVNLHLMMLSFYRPTKEKYKVLM